MRKVRVRGVITHDNKWLFVKLKKYPDFWCLPGGGVEDGEQLEDALRRELVEELGIKPEIDRLLYVHQFQANEVEQLEFIFLIRDSDDYLDIDLSQTTHGEIELAEIGFIDPVDHKALPEFLKNELRLIPDQRNVKFFSYLS